MAKKLCHGIFLEAMQQRITNHPFDRISAYKIKESRDNINRLSQTVGNIIPIVTYNLHRRRPQLLGCCTTEDKAMWLKGLPYKVAHEFGYNLIPAILGLNAEGVPAGDIIAFSQSIKRRIFVLFSNCDSIQASTSQSIKVEYARMKAGNSSAQQICKEATDIANLAVLFCRKYSLM